MKGQEKREDRAVKKEEVRDPLVAGLVKVRPPCLSALVESPLPQPQGTVIPLKLSQLLRHTPPDPAVPMREICSTDITTL